MGRDRRSPAEVIIGIDVGTTAAKVSAFGLDRPWRHSAMVEYPLLRPQPGWATQEPDVLIAATLQSLAEVVSACAGARVVGLALSSAMHGLIGLDRAGRPLTPLLTWADARAGGVAGELRQAGLAAELHRVSGTPVHSMSPLTKLIWLRRHDPALFARVQRWVGLKDWLILALTGTLATELSSASATGLLDLATRSWSPAALELAGISSAQLPPVMATTAALGLAAAVADRVGLPAGTPVVLGAGDGPLGNLGTGALDPGVAGLSVGTSGALRTVVPHPMVDQRGTLFCYALTDDAWVIGGAISNGGSVMRWAAETFGPPLTDDASVLALAATAPAGSDGLIALPFLMAERAPLWDPTLSAAFLGVRTAHTREHFLRACLEGVAQQLWTIFTQLDALLPVTSIRATGGVFRSALWRRVLTDVLERPITVTDGADGTALGAAALGLYALDRAPSLHAALDMLRTPEDDPPTVPDPAAMEVYRLMRARIPALLGEYAATADLFGAPAPTASPGG